MLIKSWLVIKIFPMLSSSQFIIQICPCLPFTFYQLYTGMLRHLITRHLIGRAFLCSPLPGYRGYLSDHVIRILEAKPEIKGKCISKFEKIIQKYQQPRDASAKEAKVQHEVGSKMNMVFRIYSLPEVLAKYTDELAQMVTQGHIKNQSQLDRVCSLLTKKIKTNNNLKLKQIMEMKSQAQNEKLKFQQIMKELEESNQEISIPEQSKVLREKFITIDSKQIYDRLKLLVGKKKANAKKDDSQIKEKENKQFWDKLSNIKPRLLPEECNDPQIYRKHQQITQGRLRFRFPPEPNGYLHIGHIKSIRINFETAKRSNGICFLRYDDTNPETESHQYIENILKNVRWLGYQPDHITYASDYFEEMIAFAIKLVKEGHAYVCDSTQIEMERERKEKLANKDRNRPIEQSLGMFPNLKDGQTLRLKLDPSAKNPTLRDPVIYRIKEQSHPRTGNKYRIYPIYDFAHCICDSLEHIDYSLCSLEFQVRRELYYKILHLLKLYKPIVWEYSRLNVEGSVISKRKIKALIDSNAISDWSDPRLLTIGGLINRGYTPSMLINFIDKVNASRAGNENIIQYSLLEREMRKELFKIAEKSMMVLDPMPVEIQNMAQGEVVEADVETSTDPAAQDRRKLVLGKKILIEKDEQMEKQGKIIVLKYFGAFEVIGVQNRQQGKTILVKKISHDIKQLKQQKKDYKVLHWISQSQGIKYPVLIFDRLLDLENKISSSSQTTHSDSVIPIQVHNQRYNTTKYWQMQRLGYFKFLNSEGPLIRCTSLQ